MKISKWVDMGAEVDIQIDAHDIRAALAEAFSNAEDKLEERPTRQDITRALVMVSEFLNGLTDEHVALLTPTQKKITEEYLRKTADRFKIPEVPTNA